MIKLIISDMDGCLLNDKKEIPHDMYEIIDALAEKQIAFAIASGRQVENIQEKFTPYVDSMYFLGENGSIVKHGKKTIYESILVPEDVKLLVETIRSMEGVYPIVCGSSGAYYDSEVPIVYDKAKFFYANLFKVDDILQVTENISKIAIVDTINPETNIYPKLQPYADRFQIACSGDVWVDINNLGENKGRAVAQLQNILGVSREETMVFGDFLNDLAMMEQADYSYAMINGHPQLKETARYITELDNNHEGVTHTIKKYLK